MTRFKLGKNKRNEWIKCWQPEEKWIPEAAGVWRKKERKAEKRRQNRNVKKTGSETEETDEWRQRWHLIALELVLWIKFEMQRAKKGRERGL